MAHQSALRVEFSRCLTPVQAHGEVLGFIWLEIVKSDLQVPEKQLSNHYHGDLYFGANRSTPLSFVTSKHGDKS